MTKIIRRTSSIFIAVMVLVMSQISVFAYENDTSPRENAPWLGEVTTTSLNLNIRANPSTSSSVVSTLKKGTYIQIIGQSGNWWKVRYTLSGKTGYVTKDYITVFSHSYGYVNTQSLDLNLRNDNGVIIGTIPKGTYIPLIPKGDDMEGLVQVVCGQTIGWVSTQYFKYK